jgi:hypothetical protein
MTSWKVRHISVTIARKPDEVYAFASAPPNLPSWARGLAGTIAQVDGQWVADSPMGRITVAFAPRNPFGVLDHDLTLPSGQRIHNPMRVLPNGDGSEVVFTLFQLPGLSDERYAQDGAAVERDLQALKQALER